MSDQGDFWRRPIPPMQPIPPARPRLPTGQRAGTILDHQFSHEIHGRLPKSGRRGLQGYVETKHRCYQGGGTYGDFVYWKRKWLTFSKDVWTQLIQTQWRYVIDYVELVDDGKNQAFRIGFAEAQAAGEWYEENIGPRFGIPERLWQVVYEPIP